MNKIIDGGEKMWGSYKTSYEMFRGRDKEEERKGSKLS